MNKDSYEKEEKLKESKKFIKACNTGVLHKAKS